jgi:hypothetical protein
MIPGYEEDIFGKIIELNGVFSSKPCLITGQHLVVIAKYVNQHLGYHEWKDGHPISS